LFSSHGTVPQRAASASSFFDRTFYVVDGRYRMQVFALEDMRNETLGVYCGDVLHAAIACGILGRHISGSQYQLADCHESLAITRLDGSTINPQPFFKDMVGWNRRALHIALPVAATAAQVRAVEQLCELSAQRWRALAAAPRD
jgi:hypothetical protein